MLRRWLEQSGEGPRVFDIVTSFNTAWPHVLERAGIMKFRWHDLRHHFASRLVQVGVPLNTVRDLLGHSSVAMSLRCAHLAPDHLIVHQDGGTAGPRLFNQLAESVVNIVRRTPGASSPNSYGHAGCRQRRRPCSSWYCQRRRKYNLSLTFHIKIVKSFYERIAKS